MFLVVGRNVGNRDFFCFSKDAVDPNKVENPCFRFIIIKINIE